MKISQPNKPPRGGWRFTDLDTDVEIQGVDFQDLVKNVRLHRASNGLPATEEIEILINNYYCQNNLVHCRGEKTDYAKLPKRKAVTPQVAANIALRKRGTAAIVNTLSRVGSGTAFTDSVTANARATICSSCPMNVQRKKKTCCGGDKGLNALRKVVQIAQKFSIKMRTHSDSALETCTICGCELKAKVWCSDAVIKETDTKDSLDLLPKDCWVREIVDES